jgi:TolB protein
VVLYLVDSGGDRYEIAAWPAHDRPWLLVDATETSALVAGNGATIDDTEWQVVDLMTGATTPVHRVGFPENTYGSERVVSLTRPTGTNVVVYKSDGTNEWLERRSSEGRLLDTVYQQPYTDRHSSLRWLYTHDGTSLLVTHHGGIAEVSNTGTVLAEIWVPADTRCDPVRWWDADTFLAACYGQGPSSAPIDDNGNPHTYYGRLWLLETDGSDGKALTEYPDDPIYFGDFGHQDAWPSGATTLIQWSGDCGASQIETLQSDGTGVRVTISPPGSGVEGGAMVDVIGGHMTVYGWQDCAASVGTLFATDLGGGYLHDLVPIVGDAAAVIGVQGLTTVYP